MGTLVPHSLHHRRPPSSQPDLSLVREARLVQGRGFQDTPAEA